MSSGTGAPLTDLYFVNNNTGYVVGLDGTVLKTTNGGANWSIQRISTGEYLYAIFFTGSNEGYVVGGQGGSLILKTTNGGSSWGYLSSGTKYEHYDIFFTDISTGYIVGEQGTIFRTTNRGINWVLLVQNKGTFLYSVYFVNSDTGFCSGYNGIILRTSNGGINWTMQQFQSPFLESIHFANSSTGFVVGSHGFIMKTSNSGLNWNRIEFDPVAFITSVFLTSTVTAYISATYNFGQGKGIEKMLKTTDGGQNWNTQYVDDSDFVIADICFTDMNTGFAAGRGNILKTTTAGDNCFNVVPGSHKLYQNFPNPFNSSTNIKYEIQTPNHVLLTIYNIRGIEVATLVNENQAVGTFEISFQAGDQASGIYFYKIVLGNGFTESKKMVLIK